MRKLEAILDKASKNKPITLSKEFWEKEEKTMAKLRENQPDLTMSYETFHRPFTI